MTGGKFTPGEAAALRRLLAQARSGQVGRLNTTGRAATSPGLDTVHNMRPEVYVARTPAGGIPALDEAATSWLGTGTETHAGTGTEILEDDAPGFADCTTWRIDYEDEGHTPALTPLDRSAQTVYNLSTTAVPGDTWVLIVRDKFGQWYVAQGGGGGAVGVCGNPDALEDGFSGTGLDGDPLDRCPVRTDNERNFPDVTSIKFDQDSFQVTPGGGCGADDSDLTGTGTNPDETRVTVRTVGHTGEIQVGVGDPLICDTACIVVETKRFLCVVRGLVYGYYDGPSAEELCAEEGGT